MNQSLKGLMFDEKIKDQKFPETAFKYTPMHEQNAEFILSVYVGIMEEENTWNAHRCPFPLSPSLCPLDSKFKHLGGTVREYIAQVRLGARLPSQWTVPGTVSW
jgi:hypothetical protein